MTQPDNTVGQLRNTDKGSEVWTGDKWEHYSGKSWEGANLAAFEYLNPKPDKLYGKIIAIEVYDDLIRYDGKPIWMGAPYKKTEAEVNAIVADYLNAKRNKESDVGKIVRRQVFNRALTDEEMIEATTTSKTSD